MSSSKSPRKQSLTKNLRQPGGQAPPGAPKIVTRSLVDLANEANLDGEELSKFVEAQSAELQRLQILHVKRNVTGLTLAKTELDAMLALFDVHGDKADMALTILKTAAEAGMDQSAVSQFALKLARMGIHQ